MGDPVVDEEGDVWVLLEVGHLFGGWVGGHYYGGMGGVRRGGQVGVVHERDVGDVVLACC